MMSAPILSAGKTPIQVFLEAQKASSDAAAEEKQSEALLPGADTNGIMKSPLTKK